MTEAVPFQDKLHTLTIEEFGEQYLPQSSKLSSSRTEKQSYLTGIRPSYR